jgi:hypothetical protein
MRIQFCSDLHLDFHPRREFPEILEPVAPVLALLGDIGDPESEIVDTFLDWCCRHWEQVLFVPGNHEFWCLKPGTNKTIESVLKNFRALEKKYINFKLCWRQKLYSEDGVTILATPLWSRPSEGLLPHESEKAWVDSDRSFDAETLHALHEADMAWLQQELRVAKHGTVVVLTHYPPSLMLIDSQNVGHPDETLYASDLDTLLRPPIVAWACGHTHSTIQWMRDWEEATGESGQILIITNPYGFVPQNPYYRKEAVLRIDPKAKQAPAEDEYLFGMSCKSLQSPSQN